MQIRPVTHESGLNTKLIIGGCKAGMDGCKTEVVIFLGGCNKQVVTLLGWSYQWDGHKTVNLATKTVPDIGQLVGFCTGQ